MIARPTTVALGCHGCRNAIYRAVLSAPSPSIRNFSKYAARPAVVPRQLFSTGRQLRTSDKGDGASVNVSQRSDDADDLARDEESLEKELEEEQPWFLEVDPPRHPVSQHAPTLPKVPEDAPALLEPMIKYVYEDMGLDEITMLDLRDLDSPAALGPNLIMLFATARSERHLHISSGRFVRWLRRNYKADARADGLIGPGELKTKLRRLRKKAKLMGTNASILPGGDNGISTGWVCVNFAAHGGEAGEAESFDESGRFSGFGTPQTSTTIVVQCMTEARRNDLDLETLWQGVLRKSLQQGRKIRGEDTENKAELDALVASKVQLSTPATVAGQQWQALKQASQQQQRYFSTAARRLQPQAAQAKKAAENLESPATPNLSQVQERLKNLQLNRATLSSEKVSSFIADIFHATSEETDASKRLTLVDELLLTAEERGVSLWSTETLVTLIESIATSPSYGPELHRAQKNLEFLLVEMQTPLEHAQLLRLMGAYAHRADWTRFWEVFRTSARFQIARTAEVYELAYRTMASTGDPKICTDALRWVYPEMLKEDPPVYPTGQLYISLKACILVADPAAEELLLHPPPTDSLDLVGQRRLQHREFLRVLKEVEGIRSHLAGTQARELQAEALSRLSVTKKKKKGQ